MYWKAVTERNSDTTPRPISHVEQFLAGLVLVVGCSPLLHPGPGQRDDPDEGERDGDALVPQPHHRQLRALRLPRRQGKRQQL